MIINLWSTPRTGSVWYSLKLLNDYKAIDPNAILLTEFFNKHHMDMYYKSNDGKFTNHRTYEDGCFYYDHTVVDGFVIKNKISNLRIRNIQEEEEYRVALFDQIDINKCHLILHNHVDPLPTGCFDKLSKLADRNIFIYRENFVDQLASFVIAYHTKRFGTFKNEPEVPLKNIEIDKNILVDLTRRIKVWDDIDKTGCEIIKYEDIDFSIEFSNNVPRLYKQSITSAFDKLTPNMQSIILELKKEHNK